MAISGEQLEDIVKPAAGGVRGGKKQWLAWDKCINREPGLFKLECVGQRMIALCSKCYFVEEEENGKKQAQHEGDVKSAERGHVGAFQSGASWQQKLGDQHGLPHERWEKKTTYEQQKLGLSAYYDKRWVLPDGIHTEPLEFHQG